MRNVRIDKLYYNNDDKFDYSKYTDLYVLNFLIDDDNYNLCGSKIFKTKIYIIQKIYIIHHYYI